MYEQIELELTQAKLKPLEERSAKDLNWVIADNINLLSISRLHDSKILSKGDKCVYRGEDWFIAAISLGYNKESGISVYLIKSLDTKSNPGQVVKVVDLNELV